MELSDHELLVKLDKKFDAFIAFLESRLPQYERSIKDLTVRVEAVEMNQASTSLRSH